MLRCFERLTDVLEFLNVGSSGALLDPSVASMDNCTGILDLLTSVKLVLVKSVLQSLWTTAPVFGFDFAGSSGV